METRTRVLTLGGAAALVLFALAAAGLLGACGGSPSPSPTPSAISITPVAQTGTTTRARVGDTVTVTLEANATTGYEWTFAPGDTMQVVSSRYVPDPNPSGLAGSGGTQVVTVKVTRAGTSDLRGTYARSWETPKPGAKPDFTLTIIGVE